MRLRALLFFAIAVFACILPVSAQRTTLPGTQASFLPPPGWKALPKESWGSAAGKVASADSIIAAYSADGGAALLYVTRSTLSLRQSPTEFLGAAERALAAKGFGDIVQAELPASGAVLSLLRGVAKDLVVLKAVAFTGGRDMIIFDFLVLPAVFNTQATAMQGSLQSFVLAAKR
jgi:hypothetical protein